MNSAIETLFVKNFICSRIRDRMLFELHSKKHRAKAISRFAHTADATIDPECVLIKSNKLSNLEIKNELVKHCDKNKEVYIMSTSEFDGKTLELIAAIDMCINDYMPTIIVCNDKVAFIKTEMSNVLPCKYILKRENKVIQ